VKIIILGAGQVGGTLAEHLADEKNDITVVDEQAATLKRLQERLDIRTVLGNGAHPVTLMNAGAEDADMLIAVTDSDEIIGEVSSFPFYAWMKARLLSCELMHHSCQSPPCRGIIPEKPSISSCFFKSPITIAS